MLESGLHLIEILVLISELALGGLDRRHLVVLAVARPLHLGVVEANIICNLLLVYQLVVLSAKLLII